MGRRNLVKAAPVWIMRYAVFETKGFVEVDELYCAYITQVPRVDQLKLYYFERVVYKLCHEGLLVRKSIPKKPFSVSWTRVGLDYVIATIPTLGSPDGFWLQILDGLP